jgi:hypothetical protein
MNSFHLPAPFNPPTCIRRVASRLDPEKWLQNAIDHSAVPTTSDTEHAGIDWSSVSSNVIATVLGGLLISLAGGILYLAWQVPRSQDQILYNQIEMKRSLDNITTRMERLELNDRRQDADIIRQQHSR